MSNRGVGYWFISGGDADAEDGPSYLSTDYWTTYYATQRGGAIFEVRDDVSRKDLASKALRWNCHVGAIFEPSRSHFADGGAGAGAAPAWVLRQQQARPCSRGTTARVLYVCVRRLPDS